MRTLSFGLVAAAAFAISMVISRSRQRFHANGASLRDLVSPQDRSLDQIRAAGL